MSETYCIYRIVCFATGMVYVGQTRDAKKRQREHFNALRRGAHINGRLQRAYNEYGANSFYFEVLEKKISLDQINDREVYWINQFNSVEGGFNIKRFGWIPVHCNSVPCTWNGVEYPSIMAAARANKINDTTMRERFERGYTCDADMPGKNSNMVNSSRRVIWNGIEYPSIVAAATANGVTNGAIGARLAQGYTCDDDMLLTTRPKKTLWNGIEYRTIYEAALATGIERRVLSVYVKKGYTSDEHIPASQSQPTIWNGIEYSSISIAARANNISHGTMRLRVQKGYTSDTDIELRRK